MDQITIKNRTISEDQKICMIEEGYIADRKYVQN